MFKLWKEDMTPPRLLRKGIDDSWRYETRDVLMVVVDGDITRRNPCQ